MQNMLMPSRTFLNGIEMVQAISGLFIGNDENPVAVTKNDNVTQEILRYIRRELNKGRLWLTAVREIRMKMIPEGYSVHSWSGGKLIPGYVAYLAL